MCASTSRFAAAASAGRPNCPTVRVIDATVRFRKYSASEAGIPSRRSATSNTSGSA